MHNTPLPRKSLLLTEVGDCSSGACHHFRRGAPLQAERLRPPASAPLKHCESPSFRNIWLEQHRTDSPHASSQGGLAPRFRCISMRHGSHPTSHESHFGKCGICGICRLCSISDPVGLCFLFFYFPFFCRTFFGHCPASWSVLFNSQGKVWFLARPMVSGPPTALPPAPSPRAPPRGTAPPQPPAKASPPQRRRAHHLQPIPSR